VSRLEGSTLSALLSVRLTEGSLPEVLDRLVAIAKTSLTGAEEVSITLVRRDKPWTAAYTGQLALDADELQYERGYGPCIDAGVSGLVLRVDDMRDEPRWPDYAAKVAARGVLSSLSVPLPLQIDIVGALNCYATTPDAFRDDEQVELGTELAGHIAVGVTNLVAYTDAAEYGEQMREAMASRAVIEQAKGVIMAQNRCDADRAWEILRKASMGRNVKVRALAESVVAGITTPPDDTPRRPPTP
jgi:GAF domain-containing protein